MAYRVPTFNILCNVYTMTPAPVTPTDPPRIENLPCQLRWCGKSPSEAISVTAGTVLFNPTWQPGWLLLIQKRTDVRDCFTASADVIECPADSGRYYVAYYVDDVARGFTNEYRIVYLTKLAPWGVPIP